jgi:hypothetical protein
MRAMDGHRTIAVLALVALALAAPASRGARAADPAPNHSGSAQPFVGFHKLDPIVMHNGKGRLVIEPFVRFREEHRATLDGTGPHAFSADAQRFAAMMIRHRLTLLWLDRRQSIDREDVAGTIGSVINEVVSLDAVESVSFTRFSVR